MSKKNVCENIGKNEFFSKIFFLFLGYLWSHIRDARAGVVCVWGGGGCVCEVGGVLIRREKNEKSA
jgi:hypothetical protein